MTFTWRKSKLTTIDGTKLHPSLTLGKIVDRYESSETELEYIAFCIACGEEHWDIDPDAENYHCEHCEEFKVYGVEQLILLLA